MQRGAGKELGQKRVNSSAGTLYAETLKRRLKSCSD